jgi:hypothetical protein
METNKSSNHMFWGFVLFVVNSQVSFTMGVAFLNGIGCGVAFVLSRSVSRNYIMGFFKFFEADDNVHREC